MGAIRMGWAQSEGFYKGYRNIRYSYFYCLILTCKRQYNMSWSLALCAGPFRCVNITLLKLQENGREFSISLSFCCCFWPSLLLNDMSDCEAGWSLHSPIVLCLLSADALRREEGNGLEMGRKEIRKETEEITASSYLHNSVVLVNTLINESSGGIEGLLDLWRTCKFVRFKWGVKISWRVDDVSWKSQDIVQKGEVEAQHLTASVLSVGIWANTNSEGKHWV